MRNKDVCVQDIAKPGSYFGDYLFACPREITSRECQRLKMHAAFYGLKVSRHLSVRKFSPKCVIYPRGQGHERIKSWQPTFTVDLCAAIDAPAFVGKLCSVFQPKISLRLEYMKRKPAALRGGIFMLGRVSIFALTPQKTKKEGLKGKRVLKRNRTLFTNGNCFNEKYVMACWQDPEIFSWIASPSPILHFLWANQLNKASIPSCLLLLLLATTACSSINSDGLGTCILCVAFIKRLREWMFFSFLFYSTRGVLVTWTMFTACNNSVRLIDSFCAFACVLRSKPFIELNADNFWPTASGSK